MENYGDAAANLKKIYPEGICLIGLSFSKLFEKEEVEGIGNS